MNQLNFFQSVRICGMDKVYFWILDFIWYQKLICWKSVGLYDCSPALPPTNCKFKLVENIFSDIQSGKQPFLSFSNNLQYWYLNPSGSSGATLNAPLLVTSLKLWPLVTTSSEGGGVGVSDGDDADDAFLAAWVTTRRRLLARSSSMSFWSSSGVVGTLTRFKTTLGLRSLSFAWTALRAVRILLALGLSTKGAVQISFH